MLRSTYMNQKGFLSLKAIVVFLIVLIIIIGGLFLVRNLTEKSRKNYVEGEIVVIFKDGVTYGEAEDYMNSIGLTLNNPDDFNNSPNTDPATRLDIHDIYTVKVPKGKEDEMANIINQKNIINAAGENLILHLD